MRRLGSRAARPQVCLVGQAVGVEPLRRWFLLVFRQPLAPDPFESTQPELVKGIVDYLARSVDVSLHLHFLRSQRAVLSATSLTSNSRAP
jgi:hypothetical protein